MATATASARGQLTVGTPLSTTLNADEVAIWTFNAAADGAFTVSLNSIGVHMAITAPDGTMVFEGDGQVNAQIDVAMAGAYTITLSPGLTAGPYTLTVTLDE